MKLNLSRFARCQSFTLSELLVVVVILSILMVLLLPTLQKQIEITRRTQCSSNLQQIATASALWSGEHNGQTVPAWDGPSLQFWICYLTPYIATNSSVWVCPSNHTNVWPAGYARFKKVDYSANGIAVFSWNPGCWRPYMAQYSDPSKTVQLVDGNGNIFSSSSDWDARVLPKIHLDGINVLFFDGHVQYFKNLNYTNVQSLLYP